MIKQSGINPDAVTYIQTGSASNSYSLLLTPNMNTRFHCYPIPFNVLMKQKDITG